MAIVDPIPPFPIASLASCAEPPSRMVSSTQVFLTAPSPAGQRGGALDSSLANLSAQSGLTAASRSV
jgi:hypothetical protein